MQSDFFDEAKYMRIIESNNQDESKKMLEKEFAQRLCKSTSFTRFLDGYLEEDVTNFDMTNSILCMRYKLNKRYKHAKVTLNRYDEQLKLQSGFSDNNLYAKIKEHLNKEKESPEFDDKSVHFNYKLPSIRDRMMLFEKIQYLNDSKHDNGDYGKLEVRSQV